MSFVSERAHGFQPLDDEATQRWMGFGETGPTTFPMMLGISVIDVRRDYCRMLLAFRDELLQAGGFMHGGAVASLLDHVMVPAVGGVIEPGVNFSTVDMHVQFIRGIVASAPEDVIAEGWVIRRGRRTVFCEAEAYGATTGELLAKSVLTYAVSATTY